MGISRATFGRIVESARRKVADAIVNGESLRIEGGAISIAEEGETLMKIAAPSREGCGCKSGVAVTLAADGVTHMVAGNMGAGAVRLLAPHGITVIRGAVTGMVFIMGLANGGYEANDANAKTAFYARVREAVGELTAQFGTIIAASFSSRRTASRNPIRPSGTRNTTQSGPARTLSALQPRSPQNEPLRRSEPIRGHSPLFFFQSSNSRASASLSYAFSCASNFFFSSAFHCA